MHRILFLLAVAIVAMPAAACLWDSDTLADEAKGHLDFIRVVTGRFERNPPIYYEMRLARVSQLLKTDPRQLDAYDDAGVACDRLGRDDDAIGWMQKKRAHLSPLPANQDEWYRYYANLGTFYAHQWFRGGAKKKELSELGRARDLIAKAIEINPNAHFGREWVQLGIIRWIIGREKEETNDSLASYLLRLRSSTRESSTVFRQRLQKGLLGLIALGNAWESVDTFSALAESTALRDSNLRRFCLERVRELRMEGKRGLFESGSAPADDSDPSVSLAQQVVMDDYSFLRREAESYSARRVAFMTVQMQQGKHPDTDSDFWSGFVDSRAPDVPDPGIMVRTMIWIASPNNAVYVWAGGAIALAIAVYVGLKIRDARRRRRFLSPS